MAAEDIEAVVAVLQSDFLTQGAQVPRFEEAVADYVGARHAVAVSSGTAALHLACLAAGMGPGGRGVTAALTFVASANAMLLAGGEAALVDIDGMGLGMAPAALKEALDADEVRVVMPVHFGGLAWASEDLRRVSGDRVVIEDAAHSLGGRYEDGAMVGSGAHADMTVFSLHPVKSITTGEGGLITTNDEGVARTLRLLRSHGIEREPDRFRSDGRLDGDLPGPWHYEQQQLGFNYRLTDLQAALGLSQLGRIDGAIARRREIALRYDAAFAGSSVVRPHQAAPSCRQRSAHHLYVLDIDFAGLGVTRTTVMERLRSSGVGSQVHYIPVYRQPFHVERYGWTPAAFPATERYFGRCLTLPMHPGLAEDEVDRVIEAVHLVTGG
jgi:perosamine synthetase